MSKASEKGFEKFEQFLDEWSRRDFLKRTGGAVAMTAFMAGGMEAFLAACGTSSGGTTTTTVAKKGGKIVHAAISDPKTFNPVLASDQTSTDVINRIFDALITSDATGNPVPLIAQSWKTSTDGLTYTYNLRKDVKFTDGHELTSDDVKFTYDLMFDPKYKDVNSPRRSDLETYVQSISNPDKYTFVVQLKKIYAPFLLAQSLYGILPKHVLGSMSPKEINTADYNSNPTVTNGTFKFVSWKKDESVTVARNDTYYRGAPNLDNYIYKRMQSTDILNQLKTGEIDIGSVDAAQFDAGKAVDSIDMITAPRLSFDFYLYQLDPNKPAAKIFGEKVVRQALLYALNRQAMADAVYFKQATVANSVEPPPSWAYSKDTKPVYNFDKVKAEKMLDGAGWVKGSDGVRAKSGVKMQFEIITNAGNKVRENLIQVMSQQWHDIGVTATPKPVDFNKVLVPAITNTRNFDIIMVGFNWSLDPDVSAVFHSRNSAVGGFNGMLYKNDAVDKALDDAVATLDQKKRKELYLKVQNLLADDVPAPILTFPSAIAGINKRVKNYNATSPYIGVREFLKDLWVTDGK